MVDYLINNKGIQVLTDHGWSNFSGLQLKGKHQTVTIKTDKSTITCTLNHEFYDISLKKIKAASLLPGHQLSGKTGAHRVVSLTLGEYKDVYDLVDVEKNHRFYADDILISNCEFIIFEETLINSLKLVELAGIDPSFKQGQIRWYKRPEQGNVYVVGLDPSLGTGGDPAAIQVVELPSMLQVSEWQHNKTPVSDQVRVLADITKYIAEETRDPNNVYYSLENNTLGEAALVAISNYGEENINGIFLSASKDNKTGRYRRGFNTTNKSKLTACSILKNLVETGKLRISSKSLISELKTFIAHGGSFAAKQGETDDLVMALLLVVRMMEHLREYDSTLDLKMRDENAEIVMPMPFVML